MQTDKANFVIRKTKSSETKMILEIETIDGFKFPGGIEELLNRALVELISKYVK